jgi:cytochrome c553
VDILLPEISSSPAPAVSTILSLLLFTTILGAPAGVCASSRSEQEIHAASSVQPDLRRGQELFGMCVVCHSSDGSGSPEGGAPAIAGQYFSVIVGQLIDFRHGRRRDLRMERVVESHHLIGAHDLADVAGYVASLAPTPVLGTGPGEFLDHGMDVYDRLCAACHGASALGSPTKAVPWLAGQHYEYLLREMYYTVDHRRPNLSREHLAIFSHFDRSEFEGLADYLSRLKSRNTGAATSG